MAAMGDLAGPAPLLDLGKKLSVPQDLMMEELSLRNNKGSLLFQKRQRRVQRFTFEFAASPRMIVDGSAKGKVMGSKVTGSAELGMVANGPEGQNCRSELHIFPASSQGPEDTQSAAFPTERACSPSALAPGPRCPLEDPWWARLFPEQAPLSPRSSSVAWNSFASDPASTEWPRAGSAASLSPRSCSPSPKIQFPCLGVWVTSRSQDFWMALPSL
ncbi:myozenin-3 isoform X2 [Neovison vison]|uniref:myozenin-3 isoform X2 n=1 Tax=Neovison vison TaxID=452646 RepID=UPI001CEFBCE8|nr:myozenin-3 isoform X2 [Neogale vison]